jgi:ribosomal protein S18 acetylase RimI-like enzyme
MITYTFSLADTTPKDLNGFFVGWSNPPTPEKLLEILQNSQFVLLAKDKEKVAGFINALSDGVLTVYIPLLEVLPEYQNQGIGKMLVQRLLSRVDKYYMVDLTCDQNLQGFYEKIGMKKSFGMSLRNYNSQSGL